MNIIVFGAIGGTGWTVNVEALVAGHIVTAFAHDANKIALADNLIVVKGDVMVFKIGFGLKVRLF